MQNLKKSMTHFFEEALEAYLAFIAHMQGYSPTTVRTYRLNLEEALRYVGVEGQEDEKYLIDLMPYRLKLIGKNKKTIYKKVSIFRSFSYYLRDQGAEITLKNDDNVKVSKTLPKPISTGYIFEAMALCDTRERLMLLLLYGLGIRISELAHMRVKDIENEWVRINGKGAKIREIPLMKSVRSALESYLKTYEPQVFVFEQEQTPMSEQQLRYRVSKAFKKIGIYATPHQLRHAFATDLLSHGARITDVSALLGHMSLETTQIYTKLGSVMKMENYQKAHPLCKEQDASYLGT